MSSSENGPENKRRKTQKTREIKEKTTEHGEVLDEKEDRAIPKHQETSAPSIIPSMQNLYLETVNRNNLDFDFEKNCSVSLTNINIYACLVCGKYYQGRGKSSFAYVHSIDYDHHVFINLSTRTVYLLPENCEVKSNSLSDIKYLIDPVYDTHDISKLDIVGNVAYDLKHNKYIPGYIGLNNISNNDYSNAIIQLMSHIKKLRNFFLLESNKELINQSELNQKFGLLIRKLWSSKLFKSHVSPQELLQLIDIESKKHLTINKQGDPKQFLIWILNNLHMNFIKYTKTTKNRSIISSCFQGKVKVTSQKLLEDSVTLDETAQVKTTKFWLLTLTVPPISVFKSGTNINKIPQTSILNLLSKYDGSTSTHNKDQFSKFKIVELPQYLILHIDRSELDNPTVVKFPLVLDMSPYYETKNEYKPINYKLISNVSYDLKVNDSLKENNKKVNWKVQLENSNNEWYNIENLEIKEIEKELIFLNQTYLQVWERL